MTQSHHDGGQAALERKAFLVSRTGEEGSKGFPGMERSLNGPLRVGHINPGPSKKVRGRDARDPYSLISSATLRGECSVVADASHLRRRKTLAYY